MPTITDLQIQLAGQEQTIQQQDQRLRNLECALSSNRVTNNVKETLSVVEEFVKLKREVDDLRLRSERDNQARGNSQHAVTNPALTEHVEMLHKDVADEELTTAAPHQVQSSIQSQCGASEVFEQLDEIRSRLSEIEKHCKRPVPSDCDNHIQLEVMDSNQAGQGELRQVVHSCTETAPQADGALTNILFRTPCHDDLVECKGTGLPEQTSMSGEVKSPYQIEFGRTIWDASALVWIHSLGFSSSLFLSIVLLLNIFIQGYMCYIILTDEEFSSTTRFSDLEPAMRQWRISDGHRMSHVDEATGLNLVSRVCASDVSLSIASMQAALVEEINTYLSLEELDFEIPSVTNGTLLAMLCVSVFALLIIQETNQTFLFAISLSALPHHATELASNVLVSISYPRLWFCMLLCAMRLCVAFVLLYSGAIWISSTTSIVELILNAAALAFVMDVDEILAGALLPERVLQVLRNMAPLQLPPPPGILDAVVSATLFVCVLVATYTQGVSSHVADMVRLKKLMCGGLLNFAIFNNEETKLFSSVLTAEFKLPELNLTTQMAMAVTELVDFSQPPVPHVFALFDESLTTHNSVYFGMDAEEFVKIAYADVEELALRDNFDCEDFDFAPGLAGYFTTVRYTSGVDVGIPYSTKAFKCSDFLKFCGLEKSKMLRFLCPRTCGCDDAASGLFIIDAAGGCPIMCRSKRYQKFKGVHCVDKDQSSPAAWSRYWDDAMLVWRSVDDGLDLGMQKFIQDVKAKGCTEAILYADRFYNSTNALGMFAPCDETYIMTGSGHVSAFALCKKTCCESKFGPQLPVGACPPGCGSR